VENPTRRRVLAAGLTGTALGLLGGKVASASADTTPTTEGGSSPETSAATTTTLPPKRPTTPDIDLLNFAEGVELAARDLYQAAVDAGAKDDLVKALLANHRGYADVIKGQLGTKSAAARDDDVYDQFLSRFKVADLKTLATPAYELESIAVATHTELLNRIEGVDPARLLASILIVEARQAAVLADVSGKSGDYDALFDDSADALTPPSGG
jgi:hypothetical protein